MELRQSQQVTGIGTVKSAITILILTGGSKKGFSAIKAVETL
jgi:hypothetical protein